MDGGDEEDDGEEEEGAAFDEEAEEGVTEEVVADRGEDEGAALKTVAFSSKEACFFSLLSFFCSLMVSLGIGALAATAVDVGPVETMLSDVEALA